MITEAVPFTAFSLPSIWLFHIGIKHERNELWYIRKQWVITLFFSQRRASNQIINVRGNVTMTKQMPMYQKINDLKISIKFFSSSVYLCESSVQLHVTNNLRTDTENSQRRHREPHRSNKLNLAGKIAN